jgi:peroxiredoxin
MRGRPGIRVPTGVQENKAFQRWAANAGFFIEHSSRKYSGQLHRGYARKVRRVRSDKPFPRTKTMMRNLWICVVTAVLVLPAGVLAQSDRTQIHAQADQVEPLLPGMKAPAFKVHDLSNNPVAFNPDRMEKPLIITFFRGGWCPYCNLHLAELRHAEKALTAMGFALWFISIDRPELLYASLENPDIGYTMYSDSSLEATRAFGIAFKLNDETVRKYQGYGIDLEAVSGESHHVLPAPSTFLVGVDGVVRFQYTNPDYTVRLSPNVLLAAARAYTDDEDQRLVREYKKQH